MNEIWKPIEGTDGKYEVSNTGKVRSLNYAGRGEAKCLKPKMDKYGYLTVHFSVNGKRKHRTIHRLVAIAFIPNPNGLPAINHKDTDKTNNDASNLEWVTNKENTKHAQEHGLLDNLFKQRDIALNEIKKPIVAVNIKTGEETLYESQNAARQVLGTSAHRVVSGHNTQSNGYVFYEPSDDKQEDARRKEIALDRALNNGGKGANKRKSVVATNLTTGEKKWYKSAAEARDMTPNNPCVYDVLSGKIQQSKGYTFEYVDSKGVVS